MKKFVFAAVLIMFGGIGTANAQFVSATACKAAQAWNATAGKCVSCKSLVTDSGALKSCMACKAGTAFDITAAKCVKVTVGRS